MEVPHLNVFALDPIRVVTLSNGTAADKRAKAKTQMDAYYTYNGS